jgi:VWFA-related protein
VRSRTDARSKRAAAADLDGPPRVVRVSRSSIVQRLLSTALLCAAAARPGAPHQAPSSERPTPPPVSFGVEVGYVEVDALVTDKDRQVVRGLTREDFEILEEGKAQSVELAALVDLELPPLGARQARPVEPDVRTNSKPFEGRLYVVVLDDLHTAALRTQGVRAAARRFIEQYFGDEDLAAVVHTSGRADASQDLTGSRRLLLEAVDKFMGRRLRSATLNTIDVYYELTPMERDEKERLRDPAQFERGHNARAALSTLRNVAEWLGHIRGRRKAVLYLSEGIDYDIHDTINNPDAGTIRAGVRELVQTATRGNVSLYTLDPRGLHTMSDELMEMAPVQDTSLRLDERGLQAELRLAQDSLRVLAEETLGRAAVATNDFAGAFESLVRDNSSYYVLGYRPANERPDGRFRKIQVRVKRPGLSVRARGGYVLQRMPRSEPPSLPGARLSAELRGLLERPLQQAGLPLTVHAAPFQAAAGAAKASVMVTVHVGSGAFRFAERDGVAKDVLEVGVIAMDAAGKMHGKDHQVNLAVKPHTRRTIEEGGFRVVSEIELSPGRHQLRVLARTQNTAQMGSVFYDLEVPDFEKADLAVSTLVLSSAAAGRVPTAGGFELLRGVLETRPTTSRDFAPGETLEVIATVYGKALAIPHAVDVTTAVLDGEAEVRFRSDEERQSEGRASTGGGAFLHKAQVPRGRVPRHAAGGNVRPVGETPHGIAKRIRPPHGRYTAPMPFDAIARRHEARLLVQYGSTVEGRTHAASDVDIAVLFEGKPDYAHVGALLADLQAAFPGRDVDLGLLNHADPLFLKKVLESARLLAGSPRELASLRLYAFRRYQDHRRFLRLEERHMDRFLAARSTR